MNSSWSGSLIVNTAAGPVLVVTYVFDDRRAGVKSLRSPSARVLHFRPGSEGRIVRPPENQPSPSINDKYCPLRVRAGSITQTVLAFSEMKSAHVEVSHGQPAWTETHTYSDVSDYHDDRALQIVKLNACHQPHPAQAN